jgi:hypothetical protein
MIISSFMFRHRNAIFRESTKTKEQVQHAKSGIDGPHCHLAETCRSVMILIMNCIYDLYFIVLY